MLLEVGMNDMLDAAVKAALHEARVEGADSSCDYGDAEQICIAVIKAIRDPLAKNLSRAIAEGRASKYRGYRLDDEWVWGEILKDAINRELNTALPPQSPAESIHSLPPMPEPPPYHAPRRSTGSQHSPALALPLWNGCRWLGE